VSGLGADDLDKIAKEFMKGYKLKTEGLMKDIKNNLCPPNQQGLLLNQSQTPLP
jgi:hypothetical protein